MNYPSYFLFFILIIFLGCKTREVEPPTDKRIIFIPPTNYDIVLYNFQNSINYYIVENYLRCFVDTTVRKYEFIPSTSSYNDRFFNWSLDDERTFFQNLCKSLIAHSLILERLDSSISEDNVAYHLKYELEINDTPNKYNGKMWLHLMKTKGYWAIYKWQDIRTTSDFTWSYLKVKI